MSTVLCDQCTKLVSLLRSPDDFINKEMDIIECLNDIRRLPIENYLHIGLLQGSDECRTIYGETILHVLCSVTAYTSSLKVETLAHELMRHIISTTSLDPSLCNNMIHKYAHITSWSAMNKVLKSATSSSGQKSPPPPPLPLCGAGSTSLLHYAMYAKNMRCMLLLLDSGARLTNLVPNLCRKSPRPVFYEPNHVVDCVLDRSPNAFAACGRFVHGRPFDTTLLRYLAYWVRWREVRGLWLFLVKSANNNESNTSSSLSRNKSIRGEENTRSHRNKDNRQLEQHQNDSDLANSSALMNGSESCNKQKDGRCCPVRLVLSIDPLCRIIKSYLQTPPGGLSIRAVVDAVSVNGGKQNEWGDALSHNKDDGVAAVRSDKCESCFNSYRKIDMRRKASSTRKHFFWSLPTL